MEKNTRTKKPLKLHVETIKKLDVLTEDLLRDVIGGIRCASCGNSCLSYEK
jgi:hypothetical protein